MAEFAGLVLGIVPLVVQITTQIDRLNDIRNSAIEAPAELSSLLAEIKFVNQLLSCAKDDLQQGSDCDESILNHCKNCCSQLVEHLEVLNTKLHDREQSRFRNRAKILGFRHWRKDTQRLHESIQVAKHNLILLGIFSMRSSSGKTSCLAQSSKSSTQVVNEKDIEFEDKHNDHSAMPHPTISASDLSPSLQDLRKAQPASQRIKAGRSDRCASSFCSCACHRIVAISTRFWALEYSPLAVFLHNCDAETCSATKYGVSFRIALSQFGINRAVISQFCILLTSGGASLRSALTIEHVVPYTSLGFETIWKVKTGQINIKEAQDTLTRMFRKEPSAFRNHVNPSGVSYIEVLVEFTPQGPVLNDIKALLNLFISDFGMTRGIEHSRFLIKCAQWIGEGPHLDLLESLLDLRIEMPELDSSNWPEPCSPNWICERWTPDPFFTEYLDMLCKNNKGFAGMTPLHEAILAFDPASFKRWLTRAHPNERNDLGQTPLHFAISRPQFLNALIRGGHDVNSVDNHGITPLMYAAAMDQQDTLGKLIESGAELFIRCSLNKRTFLDYAIARGNWKLVLFSLAEIGIAAGLEVANELAETTTMHFLNHHISMYLSVKENVDLFEQLLAKCGSVNFLYNDLSKGVNNNSLMHDVNSVHQVEALMKNNFTLINHKNSEGQHPLITAAQRSDPGLLQALIAAGADVNLKDNWERTALYYSLANLQAQWSYSIERHMGSLRILLSHGASALIPDNCRCPCSPGGCLPTSALAHSTFTSGWWTQEVNVPVWSLEVLHALQELHGQSKARLVLLSFIRKAEFDKLGMTHVCCQRETRILDDDATEILEEESDFVDLLEKSMDRYIGSDFDELLASWVALIKESLEIDIVEAEDYNKRLQGHSQQNGQVFAVDRKQDRFVEIYVALSQRKIDPIAQATRNVAGYIQWMKDQGLYEGVSHVNNRDQEMWYKRRHYWIKALLQDWPMPSVGGYRDLSSIRQDKPRRPTDKAIKVNSRPEA